MLDGGDQDRCRSASHMDGIKVSRTDMWMYIVMTTPLVVAFTKRSRPLLKQREEDEYNKSYERETDKRQSKSITRETV
ncbi:hypothetical protein BDW42DRAFT_138488 [Aspergillus taichungensis]|uniref:Uncharacterized protein n=1 Tax=Aspergillus taichungensis TaxID=482145 RepID=A0A2J5HNM5_9EURO|nr:hypothetical protein BDW42DRAFT_138488 [Aspergillus taichungensis]